MIRFVRRKFSLLLVTALVCIGVSAITLLFGWYKGEGLPSSSHRLSAGHSTSWEVYRNEVHGYRVEYPRGWRVKDQDGGLYFKALDDPSSRRTSDVSIVVQEKSGFVEASLEEYVTRYAGYETGPVRVPRRIERLQTKANLVGYRVEWEPSSWSAGKMTYTTFFTYPKSLNSTLQIETIEGRFIDVYDKMVDTFRWSL